MARIDVARRIVDLVGDSARLDELGNGWPTTVELATGGSNLDSALHVSNVSPHARRPYEWRFQNPGDKQPVASPSNALPLLVGLDVSGAVPILIVADGRSRLGREARFSILFDHRIAAEAIATGWSEYVSSTRETIYAIWPQLLPVVADLIRSDATLDVVSTTAAINASGLLDDGTDESAARARRGVTVLVRDARFARDVKRAYRHRCAMCGIRLGLVVGAHIYPVNAPGSPDEVWNGVALCENHHKAFDRHGLWIDSNYEIRISPALARAALDDADSTRFLNSTRSSLLVPDNADDRPQRAMLLRRYEFYAASYEWAPSVT